MRLDIQDALFDCAIEKPLVHRVGRNLETQVAAGFAKIQRERIPLNRVPATQQSLGEIVDLVKRNHYVCIRREDRLDIRIYRKAADDCVVRPGLF
jgi:hypothetical protein